MKVIIVEDEQASQQYLSGILNEHFPELRIVSVADNVASAVSDIHSHKPDLIFLDVEIKMGTGFDVLVQTKEVITNVIFTTAFSTFAIEAFRHHALDYLLKPLSKELVIEAVERCKEHKKLQQEDKVGSLIAYLKQATEQKPKIGIPTREGIEFIPVEEIVYGVANGNYTTLWIRNGVKVVACQRIKEIEKLLPPNLFFRIHHSYVVNLQHVDRYQKGRGGYLVLYNGTALPVSVTRKDEFMAWLNSNH